LLALVGGKLSIDFEAKIGAGKLRGNVSMLGLIPLGHKGITARIEGSDLPSASLPARLATNGLPMSGKLDLSADFDLPKEKNKAGVVAFDWSKAEGSIELECPTGCSFGDGKSKWKPIVKNHSQQGMVGDGIEIEPIDVTKLDAKIEIKDGHAKVIKIDAPSPDAELKLDFDMKLAPSLDDSIVTGCVRFKIADGLYKRKPKAEGAIRNTGAELRSDGYFHIKLADTWRDMKRLNAECGPNAKPDGGTEGAPGVGFGTRPVARPNLQVTPEDNKGSAIPPPIVPPSVAGPPPRALPEVTGSGSAAAPQPGTGEGAREREQRKDEPAGSGSAGSNEPAPGSGTAGAGGPPNAVLQ
jgi:type II secretion system protein N